MRSVLYCVSLSLVFMICFPMGYAFAESVPAADGSPIVSANNTLSATVGQQAVGSKAAVYTSTVTAGAGGRPDSGEVKQVSSPQESSPSPSQPKASFWQRLKGRKKVDCSSGVCIYK
jgi:hypothetical protein